MLNGCLNGMVQTECSMVASMVQTECSLIADCLIVKQVQTEADIDVEVE